MKKRTSLLMGAAFATALGVAGIASMAADNAPDNPGYEETIGNFPQKLDSSTLAAIPDDPQAIMDYLQSDALKGKYVVVELVAGWCPYCAQLKPQMDEAMANIQAGSEDFTRLTIVLQEGDAATHTRGDMAYINTFRALSKSGNIPEVQVWRDGQLLTGFVGPASSANIETFLNQVASDYEALQNATPAPAAPQP